VEIGNTKQQTQQQEQLEIEYQKWYDETRPNKYIDPKIQRLRTQLDVLNNVNSDIDDIRNGTKDIESYSEFLYLQIDQLENKLENLELTL